MWWHLKSFLFCYFLISRYTHIQILLRAREPKKILLKKFKEEQTESQNQYAKKEMMYG